MVRRRSGRSPAIMVDVPVLGEAKLGRSNLRRFGLVGHAPDWVADAFAVNAISKQRVKGRFVRRRSRIVSRTN
jgi:hypothetical protein